MRTPSHDTPATGEIVGVAVIAALRIARRNPDVDDQRISDLASGLAIAMTALEPGTPLTPETLDRRMQKMLRADMLEREAPGTTLSHKLADAMVAATGLQYANAHVMARAAIRLAGTIELTLPGTIDGYRFVHDDAGYRIVCDGVVLAQLVEPLGR